MGSLAEVGDKVQACRLYKGKMKWGNAMVVSVLNEVYTVFFVGKGKKQHEIGKTHIKPFTKKEKVIPVVVDLTKEEDVKPPVIPSDQVIDVDVARPSFGGAVLGDDAYDNDNMNDDPYYMDRRGDPYAIPGDPYANDPPMNNYYNSGRDAHTGGRREETYPISVPRVPDVVKEPEPEPEPKPKTLEEQEALRKRFERAMGNRHPSGYDETQKKIEEAQQRRREQRQEKMERRRKFRARIPMRVPETNNHRKLKEKREKARKEAMEKMKARKAAAEKRRENRRKAKQPNQADAETESEDDDDSYDSSDEEYDEPSKRTYRKRTSNTQGSAPPRKESRLGIRATYALKKSSSPDSLAGLDIMRVHEPIQKACAAREEAARDIEAIEINDASPPIGLKWIGAPRRPLENQPARWHVPSCGLSMQEKQQQFQEQVRQLLDALKIKKPTTSNDAEVVQIDDDELDEDSEDEDNLPIAKRKPNRYHLRDRRKTKPNFVSAQLTKKQLEEEEKRKEQEVLRKCEGVDYWAIHNRVMISKIREVRGEIMKDNEENTKENTAVSTSSSRRKKGKPTRKRIGNAAVKTLNLVDAQTHRKVEEYEREITTAHKDSKTTVAVTPESCTCCAVSVAKVGGANRWDGRAAEKLFSVKAPWKTYKCSMCAGGIHAWCAGKIISPLTAHVLCMSCAEKGRAKFGIGRVKIPPLLCPLVEWFCRPLPKNCNKEHRKSVPRITWNLSPETKDEMERNINTLRTGMNVKSAFVDITDIIFNKKYRHEV